MPSTIAEKVRPHLHLPDVQIAALLGLTLKAVGNARRSLLPNIRAGWTAEAKTWIIAQGKAGVSPMLLVAPLHEKFGITKTPNALIGMLYRAGVSVRFGRAGKRATSPRAPTSSPTPPASGTRLRSIYQLESNHCRWPIGDVGSKDFGFCPATSMSGRPYCEVHNAHAYQSPQPRRQAPNPQQEAA